MKAFIDNKLLRKITSTDVENSFIESCRNTGIISQDQSVKVSLPWVSLLEYIDLGMLLEALPKFDENNVLFSYLISKIDLSENVIMEIYDHIFIECLTLIKALPEINPTFLLQKIRQKKITSLFTVSLDYYEKLLVENPYSAIHDLILHLAFDRICVCVTILFESAVSQIKKLTILKECLLESFQHITQDRKTSPGFFRLVEAIYAYQMREENLQSYSDTEWLLLCQSVNALKSREAFIDLFYIDSSIVTFDEITEKKPLKFFTMDSPDIVKSRLSLAEDMIKKLKIEIPEWKYTFSSSEIFYVKERDNMFDLTL